MNTLSTRSVPGYVRVGAASINTWVLGWDRNKSSILEAIAMAKSQGIQALACGELCISGYGLEDTALRWDVNLKANQMLHEIRPHTTGMVVFVGLPVQFQAKVWNCIAVLADGKIAAVIPKKRLASGTLFYEGRVYGQWPDGAIAALGPDFDDCPIGDLVLEIGGVRVALQTCEEAWGYEQTAARALKMGTDIIFNNSASPGAPNKYKARMFVDQNSAAGNCGYVYANLAGSETGGVVFDGDCRIANCGATVARTKRYSMKDVRVIGATIPVMANRSGRARMKYHEPACSDAGLVRVAFEWNSLGRAGLKPSGDLDTSQAAANDPRDVAGIWDHITLGDYDYWRKVQVAKGVVAGISGGYDSTLVAMIRLGSICRGMRELGSQFLEKLSFVPGIRETGLDPFNLMHQTFRGYSLSTENNSEKTRTGATLVGVVSRMSFAEVSVQGAFDQARRDLALMVGHELRWEVKSESLALESAQARCRGALLASVAAALDFMMLNTGNMLEMALGYCTQGADMNGGWGPIEGLFKTTIRLLLEHVRDGAIKLPEGYSYSQAQFDQEMRDAITHILGTAPTAGLQPLQNNQTDEGALGPFVVQEFIARNFIFGMYSMPDLCQLVWEEFGTESPWGFKSEDLRRWILLFIYRWNGSQWKRYCAPQGQRSEDISLMTQTDVRWPVVCDISFWVDAVKEYQFKS